MSKKIEIQYIKNFRLFSREHFLIAKGIAGVMLLAVYIVAGFFGVQQLQALVGVISAVFLFCSGYGVAESSVFKGGLPHYWENKAIKVWLPSLVALVIVYGFQTGNPIGWIEESLLGLSGWFLYILFAFYAAFWLVYKLVEDTKTQVWILLGMTAVGFAFTQNQAYAEVLPAFVLGVMTSRFGWRAGLKKLSTPAKWAAVVLLAGIAVGGYFAAEVCNLPVLTNLCWMVSKTAMAMWILMIPFFLQKLPIFGAFAIVGEWSFGIYLFAQPILSLAENDWKSILAMVVLLLVIAAVFSWLREIMVLQIKKNRRRGNPKLKGSIG